MSRRVWLSIVAVVVVIGVFGGGWWMASSFESPSQRAAHASAPAPGVVTAQVTRGDLSQQSSFSATIRFEKMRTLSTSVGDGGDTVVTKRTTKPGESLSAGSLVSEVNGRPIFALPGQFAPYRDLTKGDTGPDVRQLQRGLTSAGYMTKASGKLGSSTIHALKRMYRAAGYSLKSVSSDSASDPGQDGTTAQALRAVTKSKTDTSNIVVAADELLIVHTLPVVLTSTPKVGDQLKGKLSITYGYGGIVARGLVAPDNVGGLAEGQSASLSAGDSVWKARITHIGALSGEKRVPVVLRGVSSEWPSHIGFHGAVVTVTNHVGPNNALIVPTLSVDTGTAGQSYVLKQTSAGHFLRLPVTELGSLSGKTAVSTGTGQLAVGDLVKVG